MPDWLGVGLHRGSDDSSSRSWSKDSERFEIPYWQLREWSQRPVNGTTGVGRAKGGFETPFLSD